MKYKIGLTLLATLGIFLATIAFVSAAVPGGATITGNGTRIGILAPTAGSTQVTSGNITSANLDTNQSTYRWAGLLGNVTGKIVLGDSTQAMLFNWTANGNLVYASNAASVTWSALTDASLAEISADYAWVATSASVSDDVTDTFVGASEPIGSNIFTISTIFAQTASLGGATAWKTYALEDGDASDVFTGKVVENGVPYNGVETADYQMIIPESGVSGDTTATSWYLWVELV